MLVQQLEVHPDKVAGQGTLAASHRDGHEEQPVLVDETSLDRLGRETRADRWRRSTARCRSCRRLRAGPRIVRLVSRRAPMLSGDARKQVERRL
jgi:hypothetical protein